MTISTTQSRVSYNGNGVTTGFAVPYLFFQNSDLVAQLVSVSGAVTLLTLNTDYTVSGAGNPAGGTITLMLAPDTGERLVIRRVVNPTQETDYISGDPFPAETHERALDKLTMLVQQQNEELSRAVKVPPTSTEDPALLIASISQSEQNAAASAASAAASLDAFDDRYLGAKASDPTVDNDGNPLLVGAEYWNTVSSERRTWTGSVWVASSTFVPDNSVSTVKLANDAVTFAKLQNIATARLLGRATAGTGDVEELTGAQATALLVPASETVSGRVELATNAEAQTGTDATRSVTPANLNATVLGMGQTWQNVIGSRAAGTTYTNTTGRTIMVCIMLYSTVGQQTLTVSGVVVLRNSAPPPANARDYFSVLIPPGATYVLSASGAFVEVWSELR